MIVPSSPAIKSCGPHRSVGQRPTAITPKSELACDVRQWLTFLIVFGLLLAVLSACSISSRSTQPSTTSSLVGSASSPLAKDEHFPISISNQLSSDGQDASILTPTSCIFQNDVLTAKGTFKLPVSESYVRYGDVVELYAYTASMPPAPTQKFQVVELASEHTFIMGGDSWTVSGHVDFRVGVPAQCLVAVQSTHAFMTAGNAGS